MKYGLDINGGVYVVMEAQTDLTGDELAVLMDQTRAVLDNRVNQLGVAESSVTIEGEKRIRVEIPAETNPEQAIEYLGKVAQLTFVGPDGSPALFGYYLNLSDGVIYTGIDVWQREMGFNIFYDIFWQA